MSYEIIYDKQFIKVSENEFVPMILAGSNNCTEFTNGRERRSRDWYPFSINSKLILSKEEMLSFADNKRQSIIDDNNSREKDSWWEEYHDNSFGYWYSLSIGSSCRKTTFGNFKGIFKTGCEKALTIEELKDCGVSVIVRNSHYRSSELDSLNISNFSETVNSSVEFSQVIKNFENHFKGTDTIPYISFSGMYDNKPKYLREKFFKKSPDENKVKEPIKVDHYFSIVAPNGFWLVKRIKRGYRYSAYPYIKVRTEKEAKNKVKRLGELYKFERINESHIFYE